MRRISALVLIALLAAWPVAAQDTTTLLATFLRQLRSGTIPWLQPNGMYYATSNGLVCDGTTDDTAALNTLLTTVYTAGGGTIFFPAASASNTTGCLITGSITLPNDGLSIPSQPSIRWTGAGWNAAAQGTVTGTGGSILTFTYDGAAVGKIISYGKGGFEIDHLVIREAAANTTHTTPFFYITNTTIHAHDNTIYGATGNTGVQCLLDVFIFGGSALTANGGSTSAFQGYGSVVRDNYADYIRRFAVLNSSANSTIWQNNTIWNHSGNATAGGAAFESLVGGNSALGNFFYGNLVEAFGYPYAYKASSNTNVFIGNSTWDVGDGTGTRATTLGAYNLTGGGGNLIIDGHNDFLSGGTPFVGATGSNTVISMVQGAIFNWQPFIFGTILKTAAQNVSGCGSPNFYSNSNGGKNIGLCFAQDAQRLLVNASGQVFGVGQSEVVVAGTAPIKFLSAADFLNNSADTGIGRNAAGVLEVNSGTLGTLRDLKARSVGTTAVAFASLPTGVEGMTAAVTDSTTVVWGATITGGGANHVLAYYNGTNWTVAGK